MIKLGDQGAYLCSRPSASKLLTAAGWTNHESHPPCFKANVVGTTGSGDCTIAGLLAGILRGLSPADSLRLAVAVGACSVEAADATSSISPLPQVQSRIATPWPKHPTTLRS
jgi:sugar/nucleoside kinase (ribokinase family)